MNRNLAEQTVAENLKKLYGFALAKTANRQDAEDLAQEIALRLYKAQLVTDVENLGAFIRRVAHNVLANYYRSRARSSIGIDIDELSDILPGDSEPLEDISEAETVAGLQREIAYLSKLQRQIVIHYYYEGRKQQEISKLLSVPVGTVKWHLFEAKKDLKKGMETMRKLTELKFNPIKFDQVETSGSVGTKGPNANFLRSALSQNIVYAVYREGKTVNELADCLGVSPVFVESEAEFLEEYGFLIKQGGRYLVNALIDESTTELNRLQSSFYEQAAKLLALELFDALSASGITDGCVLSPHGDRNFLMWALFPYVLVTSGASLLDHSVPIEEMMTRRPDGGYNLCYITMVNPDDEPPIYADSVTAMSMRWNGLNGHTLWTLDTEWSGPRAGDHYAEASRRALALFERVIGNSTISPEEYAFMAEHGYLKTGSPPDGDLLSSLQIVWIKNDESRKKLLAVGDRLKEKYKPKLDELKAPYVKAVMDATPAHLRRVQAGVLQQLFYTNGWFVLHCLKALVNSAGSGNQQRIRR